MVRKLDCVFEKNKYLSDIFMTFLIKQNTDLMSYRNTTKKIVVYQNVNVT